jgi:hypothetical protein
MFASPDLLMAIYDSNSERRYRQSSKGKASAAMAAKKAAQKRAQITIYFIAQDKNLYGAIKRKAAEKECSLSALCILALKNLLIED